MSKKVADRGKIILINLMAAGMIFFSSKVMIAEQAQETETSNETRKLPLREFIDLSVSNDTEFERILVDELFLQYEKDLKLPAGDLVLEVKGQYDLILGQERKEAEGGVSLAKLFPFAGTTLDAEYTTTPAYSSTDNVSEFTFEVSQPIAENAFGKATRLKDKIIGVEIDVARHQIIEAYEDYLAAIIVGYYDWYEAYENLKVGRSSYQQNMKLLDNMMERQKSNIALPLDVNKAHLQVLAKKEKLIELKEAYAKALNFIEKAIRYEGNAELGPQKPDLYGESHVNFEEDYAGFKERSRTYKVLTLLEEKSRLEVDEEADDLLPSINLLLGYNVKGKDFKIENEDNMVYAGVSMAWPFGDQVDKAEHETSKISLEKTKLSNVGARFQLYTDIKDLSVQINSQQELLNIAKEKIGLAESILEDETENYSFGKITLNDYIDAVNVSDNNRFNEILHGARYKKFLIEWLRITDRLISKNDIYK